MNLPVAAGDRVGQQCFSEAWKAGPYIVESHSPALCKGSSPGLNRLWAFTPAARANRRYRFWCAPLWPTCSSDDPPVPRRQRSPGPAADRAGADRRRGTPAAPACSTSACFCSTAAAATGSWTGFANTGTGQIRIDFFLEGVESTATAAVKTANRLLDLFRADEARLVGLGRSAPSVL